MPEPFLGEIRIMSFGFAPKGWALCNGQLLAINQNQGLFSVIGTTYGGNGQTTFALPDLRGRVPIHMGASFIRGQTGGEQSHTLTISEMPSHHHTLSGTTAVANPAPVPVGNYLGPTASMYGAAVNLTALHPASVAPVGSSQPHPNMQPFLTLNFSIALQGIFPSQN
jgi:microcystin-dependent protein